MADIKTFDLSDKALKIGDVFTPLKWGEFAIDKFEIFSKWLNGATVFDPTMGEGNLLESLITYGLKKGFTIESLPTNRLFGNELNSGILWPQTYELKSTAGLYRTFTL